MDIFKKVKDNCGNTSIEESNEEVCEFDMFEDQSKFIPKFLSKSEVGFLEDNFEEKDNVYYFEGFFEGFRDTNIFQRLKKCDVDKEIRKNLNRDSYKDRIDIGADDSLRLTLDLEKDKMRWLIDKINSHNISVRNTNTKNLLILDFSPKEKVLTNKGPKLK